MVNMAPCDLLDKLLAATKPAEVLAILQDIGDHPDNTVDSAFGGHYHWHFYGDRESNVSSVNLAAKPGRSLTERITNAIDAVVEKRVQRSPGVPPSSPLEAAARYFGRPPTTADNGLYAWKDFLAKGYDRYVQVVMTNGDKDTEPTIDVVDDGIGIAPAKFADTIVSLQQGNKIKKPYLSGAWGQGGSSTLAFSQFVLIVSRHIDDPTTVGFTVVRLLNLPYPYKEDAYAYLATYDQNSRLTVPSCQREGAIDSYPSTPVGPQKPKAWQTGTTIRHYGFALGKDLQASLNPSPGNLYHLLQHLMFDPLLPFRAIDLRTKHDVKNELITGSRNRLMNLVARQDATASAAEADADPAKQEATGTRLRHHAPREMVSPREGENATIGIEYWVVFNYRKRNDKIGLRQRSNELYVNPTHPILGTLHGQNQGELTARILTELRLSMLARHIVIHIDATGTERNARRELFTSTRRGSRMVRCSPSSPAC